MSPKIRDHRPLPDRAAAEEIYQQLRPAYEQLLEDTCQHLRQLFEKAGLSVTIKYRVKRFTAYCEKLVRLSRLQGDELIEITDLLGIRIVCPFLEDLDSAEKLLAEHFTILEMEHKADQHSFREFGYDSLHLLIRTPLPHDRLHLPHSSDVCEIQLRTILQEAWAEVEHELVYKSDIDLPNHSIRRKLASLNASLTLSDLIFQEIRDHQKDIRQRGLKRRQSLESRICDCGGIDIAQLPEIDSDSSDPALDLSAYPSSRQLEKLMLEALDAHSNEQFQRAIDIYSIILRLKLDSRIRSLVYNHRGMALFALAEYHKGVEDFSRAIEFNNENFRAWNNRGLAWRVLGKLDQSLKDYEQAIALCPQQYEGYWGRAQTCFEMKLYSRALDDCHRARERDADFAPARELEKAIRSRMF